MRKKFVEEGRSVGGVLTNVGPYMYEEGVVRVVHSEFTRSKFMKIVLILIKSIVRKNFQGGGLEDHKTIQVRAETYVEDVREKIR